MWRRFSFLALGALALTAACGSSALDGGPNFDLPTALSVGGAVLSSPRVQPIYFAGFPYGQEIDTFLAHLQTASYWQTVGAEYGIGALSVVPGFASTVMVPAMVTATDAQNLLGQTLQAMQAATGATARTDTIYALFFGPDTALSIMGVTLCGTSHPSGFHDEWLINNVKLPVAVLPSCKVSDADPDLVGVNIITPSLSHELIEAATDPYVHTDPAFLAIDSDHALWAEALSGAEVGDLCENEMPSLINLPDVGFPVQRIWSNTSAHAGSGPCVPVPAGEIYFNAQASLPDKAQLDVGTGTSVTIRALNASVGATVTSQVSVHGPPGAPTSLEVVAIELDDLGAALTDTPAMVKAQLGHTVSVPIAPMVATKTGLVPLLVGAVDLSNFTVHFWVGAINRQ
ncbi:MAG TPA: hypothetical protein VGL59_12635 [Polyangia bacterium]